MDESSSSSTLQAAVAHFLDKASGPLGRLDVRSEQLPAGIGADINVIRSALQVLREASLAFEASQVVPVKHGCHCELDPGQMPDGCVLDEDMVSDCCVAMQLAATGKTKESCEYWKPIIFRQRTPLTSEAI